MDLLNFRGQGHGQAILKYVAITVGRQLSKPIMADRPTSGVNKSWAAAILLVYL